MNPFDVLEPATGEAPLVIEIPHAGLWIDPEAMAYTRAPARSIARDADLYVDELFADAPSEGATVLLARPSRYMIDLNRAETDFDGDAVEGGSRTPSPRGVIWRLTTEGEQVLTERLPRQEFERRLELVYHPYHRMLSQLLERKIQRFGSVVLLCAHSMPTLQRPTYAAGRLARSGADNGAGGVSARADLVPGSRGRTSAAGVVIDHVDAHGRACGWSVRHDDPYKGGFSTAHYGRPAQGMHAVQIEIARRRYMDESTLRMDPHGFRAVREFARSLAARLALVDPVALVGRSSG